jgi:hypothetical protein
MLKALAEGETDAARLAAMAHPKLQATQERLQDALYAATTLALRIGRFWACFWPVWN